ncbi:MAG TPA: hypothetical protein VEQ60_32330 [Longimicrobium sp.]|nr:hypothetical protein [Longimicrobium sp.]
MKKLTLNADQLQVEAFHITPEDRVAKGTVVANGTIGPFTDPCICVDQPETRTCNC